MAGDGVLGCVVLGDDAVERIHVGHAAPGNGLAGPGQGHVRPVQPFGGRPQQGLVDAGQPAGVAMVVGSGVGEPVELTGSDADQPGDAVGVESHPAEDVHPALGGAVLRRHVGGCVDVDDAGATTPGPEHGEVVALVVHQLHVQARSALAQRCHQVIQQPGPHRGAFVERDGQPGVEVERER